MAISVSLERLVHALSNSIIRAQNLVEKAQLANLRTYFDKQNNTPICMDIKLPAMHQPELKPGQAQDSEIKTDIYRVPLASLVPHGALIINEAKVELDVEIGKVEQDEPEDGKFPDLAEIINGDDTIRPKLMIDPESGSIAKSKKSNGNSAHITLTLKSAESTEGLARLLNEVIKGQGRIPDK